MAKRAVEVAIEKDEEEAIKIANATSFGLGASIFTKDIEKGERIATYELQAGSCFVNDFSRPVFLRVVNFFDMVRIIPQIGKT